MKILTPIALLALSFGIFFWYISPTYSSISALKSELAVYADALDQAKQASAKRNDLVNRYKSFKPEDLQALNTLLPDKVDVLRLAVEVNEIGERHDAKLKNLKISQPVESATTAYGTVPISFAVSLSYDDFQTFLKDLEKTLRLVDISSVTFTPNDKGIYDYSLSMKVYWIK